MNLKYNFKELENLNFKPISLKELSDENKLRYLLSNVEMIDPLLYVIFDASNEMLSYQEYLSLMKKKAISIRNIKIINIIEILQKDINLDF